MVLSEVLLQLLRLQVRLPDEIVVTMKAAVKGSDGKPRRQLSMDSPHAWVLLITYVSVWKIRRNIFLRRKKRKRMVIISDVSQQGKYGYGSEERNTAAYSRSPFRIMISVRRSIAKEYDIRIVIVHCTDGIDIAGYMAASGFLPLSRSSAEPFMKQESFGIRL